VVLKQPPVGDRFSWDVQASGLSLQYGANGEISILSAGQVVGDFPLPLVTDSESIPDQGPAFDNFSYDLTDLGGGHYTLSVLYDSTYLSSPSTVYPVSIDPGPQRHTFTPSGDTFVNSSTGDKVEGNWYAVDAKSRWGSGCLTRSTRGSSGSARKR
jgi:hypothetical protein